MTDIFCFHLFFFSPVLFCCSSINLFFSCLSLFFSSFILYLCSDVLLFICSSVFVLFICSSVFVLFICSSVFVFLWSFVLFFSSSVHFFSSFVLLFFPLRFCLFLSSFCSFLVMCTCSSLPPLLSRSVFHNFRFYCDLCLCSSRSFIIRTFPVKPNGLSDSCVCRGAVMRLVAPVTSVPSPMSSRSVAESHCCHGAFGIINAMSRFQRHGANDGSRLMPTGGWRRGMWRGRSLTDDVYLLRND